jgi:hypothetical protein
MKIEIDLPPEIYYKLISQSQYLKTNPSLLILQTLEHDLGLIGVTIADDAIFGSEKKVENNP